MRKWQELKAINPSAKLICLDLQPYGTTPAKEAADILRLPQDKGCKTELLWRSGGKAKTRTTCPTSVVTSDYDLAGSSYRSVTHMEVHQDSNTATTDLTVTGTRIGDCTP